MTHSHVASPPDTDLAITASGWITHTNVVSISAVDPHACSHDSTKTILLNVHDPAPRPLLRFILCYASHSHAGLSFLPQTKTAHTGGPLAWNVLALDNWPKGFFPPFRFIPKSSFLNDIIARKLFQTSPFLDIVY